MADVEKLIRVLHRLVAAATPEDLVRQGTATGQALATVLAR